MKIKITKEIKEIDGEITERPVKPIGNSAHIPFLKEHIGKIVNVVVPDEPSYVWVLPEELRKKLSNFAKKKIEAEYKKDRHIFLGYVEEFLENEFSLDALIKVLYVLEDETSLKKEVSLVKNIYQI